MIEYWPKWIKSSIYRHFDAYKGDTTLVFDPQTFNNAGAYLKISGPQLVEGSRNYWTAMVDVSLQLVSVINDTQLYSIEDLISQYIPAFTSINVYNADNVLYDCLVMRDIPIRIKHLGRPEHNLNVQQATIETLYFMSKEV